jgi:hypothetical protein
MIEVRYQTQVYNDKALVPEKNCNAIEFYNAGDETIKVNGRPIISGGSWAIYGLNMEVITNTFDIYNPPTATEKIVIVTQKIYK